MKKITVLAALLMLAAGCTQTTQNTQTQTSNSADTSTNQNSNSFLADAKVVAFRKITWSGNSYTLNNKCVGTIKKDPKNPNYSDAPATTVPYCIGRNLLTIKTTDNEFLLSDTKTSSADNTAVLDNTALIASNTGNGNVLIEYWADPCTTQGTCDKGYETHKLIYSLNLKSPQTLRALRNYPLSWSPVWNPAGDKAAGFEVKGSGADFYPTSLLTYDINTDSAKQSTEIGYPFNKSLNKGAALTSDANGAAVSYWSSNPKWITNTQVQAPYYNVTTKTTQNIQVVQ
jgi:hypothetical protein